ncbi:MAG: LysR family transcriptional regulator [Gordonia sp. (in: high G+C Gram-positive bacteria)]|uniref:LysR family transcriptional regulator n=1 Tax=Gordonia sp. (in: high G+C Gram-positive bacteria) TaxID=84139 RepID=UPI0039E56585
MTGRLHMVRQIDVFSLRLFVSAVEEQQIGRAAAREHIAASTATKRIQALEEMVGMPLLQRGRAGVVPTEAGEVLVGYARTVLGELDDLHDELATLADRADDALTVSAGHSTIADLIAPTVSAFLADRPFADLTLNEVDNSDVPELVASGHSDVGVFAGIGDPAATTGAVRPLYAEPLVAVVPRGHRLAGETTVSFRQLADVGLVATHTTAPVFEAVARRSGFDDPCRHVVRTGEVALGMVRAGLGVTIVPAKTPTQAADDEMTVLSISDPWAVRQVSVTTRNGRMPGPAVRGFLTLLHREARRRLRPDADA